MHVIDRRRNPKSKSLGNRQRFLRRMKSHIREAVNQSLRSRKIADLEGSQEVSIRSKDLREPSFHHDAGAGHRDYVLPGNQEYQQGDRIAKPDTSGGRGSKGSPDGDGEDHFSFVLTRDEFLNLFFEDLELPNLAKKKLKSMTSPARVRAGYSKEGAPQRMNLRQTMRRSLSRRIALGRPSKSEMAELEALLHKAELEADDAEVKRITSLLHSKRIRLQRVPYLDTVDLRYRQFESVPRPTTQAVMFCLMDTSASMTEELKDLAKRFYMLLHLFLNRHYGAVELVFIRHTYTASEVDEDTFFHGRETGGTIVSSAFEEMLKVIRDRYPVEDWNIYAAQVSDGHNFDYDMPHTLELLEQHVLPLCQYYAYIEVGDEIFPGSSILWEGYTPLTERHKNFARAEVIEASEIFPVFHDLFGHATLRG
ncbi:YeaH/YhbH family protein [Novipirellula artificiosorum]|uniref:UPF0229 protein Poly41_46510 n=1 Tax=Novipirellula artificiosorum TaxID=2528016 RepID=A0A5C6DBF0_9BACT|nr:YeaH/YhbH family protein [Novipirellula artificiosorum]TWU34503.1 hypothetical protein Poly41_46510 [Novipirellula artificiosorum]